jgi:hypothetical protein
VDRAVAEIFEGFDGSLLRSVARSINGSGPGMPSSQALLLWLKETHPDRAHQVLALARRYESDIVARDSIGR